MRPRPSSGKPGSSGTAPATPPPPPHPSAQLVYTVRCPHCGTALTRIRDLDSSGTQSSRHVCAFQPTLL